MEAPILQSYEVGLSGTFREIESEIGSISELALIDIAEDAIRLYEQEIVSEGSVDTGYFLNTMGVRRAAWHERDVGSLATYAGVVRRKGTRENVGLMFPENVINELGPSIEDAFTKQLNR